MLDAAPLGLGEPAEEVHDKVVRLTVRIDGTADLRHPQFHAVVAKDWEDELELRFGESSLRFSVTRRRHPRPRSVRSSRSRLASGLLDHGRERLTSMSWYTTVMEP
jgi:hypothetical protein